MVISVLKLFLRLVINGVLITSLIIVEGTKLYIKTSYFFCHQGDWIPRWWKKVTFYFPHFTPHSTTKPVLIFTEVNLVSIFFQVCGFSQGDGISRENGGRANGAAKDKVYTLECLFSFPFHLFFNVVTICIEAASASTAYRIGSVV